MYSPGAHSTWLCPRSAAGLWCKLLLGPRNCCMPQPAAASPELVKDHVRQRVSASACAHLHISALLIFAAGAVGAEEPAVSPTATETPFSEAYK
jgi:hypothetical protein